MMLTLNSTLVEYVGLIVLFLLNLANRIWSVLCLYNLNMMNNTGILV